MAMWQRDQESEGKRDVETVIGATVKVDGNFAGSGDVIVHGHVSGTLKTNKMLQVGPGAVIKADVEAGNVMVAGEIRGHVKCSGKVDIAPTGKIFGNVETQTIAVAHGAVLHGKVTMAGHDSVPSPKETK